MLPKHCKEFSNDYCKNVTKYNNGNCFHKLAPSDGNCTHFQSLGLALICIWDLEPAFHLSMQHFAAVQHSLENEQGNLFHWNRSHSYLAKLANSEQEAHFRQLFVWIKSQIPKLSSMLMVVYRQWHQLFNLVQSSGQAQPCIAIETEWSERAVSHASLPCGCVASLGGFPAILGGLGGKYKSKGMFRWNCHLTIIYNRFETKTVLLCSVRTFKSETDTFIDIIYMYTHLKLANCESF